MIYLETTSFNVVWRNQWEPSKKKQDAFDCYSRNFAGHGIPSNEDITTVDSELFKEKNVELLVGGNPCFAAGTLITTSTGVKPIEDIQKGDLVRTHTNTFQRVVVPMMKKTWYL